MIEHHDHDDDGKQDDNDHPETENGIHAPHPRMVDSAGLLRECFPWDSG